MNDLTLFLSQLLGPIFVVLGLASYANRAQFMKVYKDMMKEPLALVIVTLSSLVIGMAIVLQHNIWNSAPEIIISLLGWLALLKGIWLSFATQSALDFRKGIITDSFLNIAGAGYIFLGFYLSWVGFAV